MRTRSSLAVLMGTAMVATLAPPVHAESFTGNVPSPDITADATPSPESPEEPQTPEPEETADATDAFVSEPYPDEDVVDDEDDDATTDTDAPASDAQEASQSAPSAEASTSMAEGAEVVVNELTNGGPGGYHDNFIEIANLGSEAQDVTGWTVYRCTGGGTQASGPQVKLDGTIEPGEFVLLAREHAQSTLENVDPRNRYGTSFANDSYGAIIRDGEGNVVDAVGVKFPGIPGNDCVSGTALPNDTDSFLGESWQRVDSTGDNAADFIKAPRTPGAANATEPSPAPLGGDVLISEVAHAGPEGTDDHLVEIGNYGSETVSLDGWSIYRCNQVGKRFAGDLIAETLPEGIEPGEALVVETKGFVAGGAGVILVNEDGATVDAVAWTDGQHSACAVGDPLPYFSLDTAAGESYQRVETEGANTEAFVAAPRGPGQLEANEPTEDDAEQEEFLSTTGGPDVRISEMTNSGPDGTGDIFFEMVNYGDEPQDLTGWSVSRCVGTGVRASVPQLSSEQLDGVVLEPGQRFTAARAGLAGADIRAAADVYFDISFAAQYGLIIFDDAYRVVDRVGSSPEGVQNYCAQSYGSLPGTISGLHAESWQRIDMIGDAAQDFHLAPRTPGKVNTREPWQRPTVDTGVVITELANGGPDGPADNFIELTNLSTEPVNIGGWDFYRCTGTGRVYDSTHQLTFPDVTLGAGQSYVAGRSGGFSGEADITYSTSFAVDGGFGVLITDGSGAIVDSVGVFTGVDDACTQGEPLPNNLDFTLGESWQRTGNTGNNAEDFTRGARTPGEHGGDVVSVQREVLEPSDVQIVEFANGGPADVTGEGSEQFVELGNRGDEPADISGYEIHFCEASGRLDPTVQAQVPDGTELQPGEAWTLVSAEAPESMPRDGVAEGRLNAEGHGILVTNSDGDIVDRVSAFYHDVGVITNAPTSICSSGVSLDYRISKTSPEKAWEHGMSFHRHQYTGDNYHDYVAGQRNPGTFEQVQYQDPTVPAEGALDPVQVDRYSTPGAPALEQAQVTGDEDGLSAELRVIPERDGSLELLGGVAKADAQLRAFSGTSSVPGLPGAEGDTETEIGAAGLDSFTFADAKAADSSLDFPYVRMDIEVGELAEPAEIVWSGTSKNRNELQMYLWDNEAQQWDLVDARSAENGSDITLVGSAGTAHVVDGVANVLIQDGPRTVSGLVYEADQAFQDPGTYDVSVGHLTDTQYVVEQAPAVFTALNSWFVSNQDARDIGFVMHTGDLIQNALRGDQLPDRAVEEFEIASAVQKLLEDSQVPHSVLPGNHDNFWGNNNDLYLEYFGEDRYANFDWWGGVGPRGATAHYSTVERDGMKLLFLAMPYDSTQAELDWGASVIAEHADHNVILGTHEYLRPEINERANPSNGRWTAQGDVFFEQLVEPHENVVLVFSGHLHGVRQRNVDYKEGSVILETVADYQSYENEDARDAVFNRLYQIDADGGEVAINAYSPVLDSFQPHLYEHREGTYTDEDDELVMPIQLQYDKEVATDSVSVLTETEVIAEATDVRGGEEFSAVWTGLSEDLEYSWFARSSSQFMGRADEDRASVVSSFIAAAEVTDPDEDDSSTPPSEDETPAPTPGEGETPEPTPGEGETPGETETPEPTPGEGETPVDPETPGDSETPGDVETPGDTETPGESESPGQTPVPSESPAETPTAAPTPGEDETPGGDVEPSAGASPTADTTWTPRAQDLVESLRDAIAIPATLRLGEEISVTLESEHVGFEVSAWLFSEPFSLGTNVVSEDATVSFSIPDDAPLGEHRFAVYGPEGDLLGWTHVTVLGAASDSVGPEADPEPERGGSTEGPAEQTGGDGLAVTGVQGAALTAGAALLLVLLGLVILQVRRRAAQRQGSNV
ncbi:lamin tail domain-containing protein [Nesterenkonia rhizosphaerae]